MVAGSNKNRYLQVGQHSLNLLQCVCIGERIEHIPGQQQQLAPFPTANFCNFLRHSLQMLTQPCGCGLASAGKSTAQMQVSGVQDLQHTNPPFLPGCNYRLRRQW